MIWAHNNCHLVQSVGPRLSPLLKKTKVQGLVFNFSLRSIHLEWAYNLSNKEIRSIKSPEYYKFQVDLTLELELVLVYLKFCLCSDTVVSRFLPSLFSVKHSQHDRNITSEVGFLFFFKGTTTSLHLAY